MKPEEVWERLGRPLKILAPMVDASELAWRLLARRHGTQLAYSPMYHAAIFVKDTHYRRDALRTVPEDRPLIFQFCGNRPEVLLEAGLLAQDFCDAIDINLGCPQAIARRGNYGAFLQDDWTLISQIVRTLTAGLRVPVTCKTRVFDSIPRTVEYARMLETSGASLLTIHGRTRDQKGPLTGLASWAHIRAVKDAVGVPVIANGNIQCMGDLRRCVERTGVDGVMSAEGHLCNPGLFEDSSPPFWEPALEYLALVHLHPCPNSFVRGHLFKMCHQIFALADNVELREEIATGSSLEDFTNAVLKLKDKFLPFHEGLQLWTPEDPLDYDLKLPPWICQPYVRIPPEKHLQKMADLQKNQKNDTPKLNGERCVKRCLEGTSEVALSKKKLKRLARKPPHWVPQTRKEMPICTLCPNPVGLKCNNSLCKVCCRKKCYTEELDCPGHRILTRTKRMEARRRSQEAGQQS